MAAASAQPPGFLEVWLSSTRLGGLVVFRSVIRFDCEAMNLIPRPLGGLGFLTPEA